MAADSQAYFAKRLLFSTLLSFVQFRLAASQSGGQIVKEIQTCLLNAGVPNERIVVRNHSVNAGENVYVYSDLNYQWETRGGLETPLGYLLAAKTNEVQAAVKCCKPLNVRIVAKGGGHSYEKYSFGDSRSFIVDLQLMDSIMVNNTKKIARVGPGVLIGPLAWTLFSKYSMVLPHGTCPTVGMSGLTLGGGYGYLSRLHGLSADNLVELKMVDANGLILRVNKNNNSDLFWALRGGGIGSYGIVTRFTFRVHSAPAKVIRGTLTYDLYMFAQVFDRWQSLLKGKLAREINAKLAIVNGHIVVEVVDVQTIGSDSGNQTRGVTAVQEILSSFPLPILGSPAIASLTYPEFLLTTSHSADFGIKSPPKLANLTRHSFHPRYWKSKSFFVKKVISYVDSLSIYSFLQQIPDKSAITIQIYAGGGAIDDLSRSATAYVHRAPNLYSVQAFYDGVPLPNKPDAKRALNWLKQFFETTKQIMEHNESYQNYADADTDMEDYLQRYYGSNLERLVQIKREVDPDNYFHYPQSIPSSL